MMVVPLPTALLDLLLVTNIAIATLALLASMFTTRVLDFYGAMDGASKFVKGDAIAAIIIVVINLVGGFAVGVLQKHLSFGDAIKTYSLLTVGDGLVAQIPALLISLSSGLIVTRAATE